MYKRKNKTQIKAYINMFNELKTNAIVQNNNLNNTKMNEQQNNGFSFANSFNKVTFSIDVTDFEYCKLATLYNEQAPQTIYRLDGMWVNKSPLGESPVFICAELGKLVNIPMHLTPTVKEILANLNAVNAIKNGKVGFKVYEYTSHGRKCYNVKFADI